VLVDPDTVRADLVGIRAGTTGASRRTGIDRSGGTTGTRDAGGATVSDHCSVRASGRTALQGDPQGYISRKDFERAWRVAHPSAAGGGDWRRADRGFSKGTFDPAAALLRGRLELSAATSATLPQV